MPTPTAPPRPVLVSVKCADITPASVSWLWEPYLARGKLAILDGDPETGKSFVTIDLAARVSLGQPLPGAPPAHSEPGAVLLLSAEDDARAATRTACACWPRRAWASTACRSSPTTCGHWRTRSTSPGRHWW